MCPWCLIPPFWTRNGQARPKDPKVGINSEKDPKVGINSEKDPKVGITPIFS